MRLTADGFRSLEDLVDLGIELDVHVPVVLDLVVANVDLTIYPVPERSTDHAVDHICDVLSWQLLPLIWNQWQRSHHRRKLLCKGQHEFDLEALVLWHADKLDILAIDLGASISSEISQVPNCNCLIGGEIDAAFMAEEVVALPLILHLRRHLFC